MGMVNGLVKLPQISAQMQEMSREMMKVIFMSVVASQNARDVTVVNCFQRSIFFIFYFFC